jgi:hypothetical protein
MVAGRSARGLVCQSRLGQSVERYRVVCPEMKSCPPRRTFNVHRTSCSLELIGDEFRVFVGAFVSLAARPTVHSSSAQHS